MARTLQSFDDAAIVISNTVSSIDVGDLAGTTDRINTTLDLINRPCTAKDAGGKALPCGTLAQVNKAVVKMQDMSVTMQRQVAQSSTLVDSAAGAINSAASDVHTMARDGSATLRTANTSIAAFQPLAASLTRNSDDLNGSIHRFNTLLDSKDLADGLHNVASMTGSGAGILADGKQVADKAREDYLKPKTPWMRVGTTTLDLIHLGAWVTR